MLKHNKFSQTCDKHLRTEEKTGPRHILAQFSLRLKGLAQASSFRLGESSKEE